MHSYSPLALIGVRVRVRVPVPVLVPVRITRVYHLSLTHTCLGYTQTQITGDLAQLTFSSRYMPKKMADNVVFDTQKFGNNQLGFINQINGKRLIEYDEPLSKCAASDNVGCSDYAVGFLKSVRITHRQHLELYWTDMLRDLRKNLFKRHCLLEACRNDLYKELIIRVGEPLGIQYQASNAEGISNSILIL
jgi:hypothetical protein